MKEKKMIKKIYTTPKKFAECIKNGSYAGAGIIASMGLMLAGIGGAMFKGYMGSSKSKLNHRE